MKKSGFSDFIRSLPPLKILVNDSSSNKKLPSYFDLMWDLKYEYQLFDYQRPSKDLLQALARFGYDVKRYEEDLKYAPKTCCGSLMIDITTQEIATWGEGKLMCSTCGKTKYYNL